MKLRKKISKSKFLIFLMFLLPICVLADGAAPTLVSYEVVISNSNGAVCYDTKYENEKTIYVKTDKTLDFGKTLYIDNDLDDKYVYAYYAVGDYHESCLLKVEDIKVKEDTFDINDTQVTKLTPVNAVIFASSLNMRKGPSTSYARIASIPNGSVVTLKYRAGTYWFYAEYNGKSGWISSNNYYLGYNDDFILYSTEKTEIYDDKNKVIGTIPAFTEITDYVRLVDYENFVNYVNYNGIKGYVYSVSIKKEGKITLLKDTKLYDGNNKVIKTLKNGSVLEYSIYNDDGYPIEFYLPKEKGIIKVDYNDYKMIGDDEYVKKTQGFIGEGLFGEKKDEKVNQTGREYEELESNSDQTNNEEPKNEPKNQNNNNNNYQNEKTNNKKFSMNSEMIIICILGTIVLALTIIIIIMLVNRKKSSQKKEKKNPKCNEKGDENEKKVESKKEE